MSRFCQICYRDSDCRCQEKPMEILDFRLAENDLDPKERVAALECLQQEKQADSEPVYKLQEDILAIPPDKNQEELYVNVACFSPICNEDSDMFSPIEILSAQHIRHRLQTIDASLRTVDAATLNPMSYRYLKSTLVELREGIDSIGILGGDPGDCDDGTTIIPCPECGCQVARVQLRVRRGCPGCSFSTHKPKVKQPKVSNHEFIKQTLNAVHRELAASQVEVVKASESTRNRSFWNTICDKLKVAMKLVVAML